MRIDLNADLGESFGAWKMGADDALMTSITSANIACGFHAGDPTVMRRTIALAQAHRVAVGAHPGFPDLAGFGRREMHLTAQEVEDVVLYQLAALAGVAAASGVRLQHVKPHGALYNMAARDGTLASAIARAVAAFDRSLILFGLPNSPLIREGERAGLPTAAEIFADRTYEADGSLTSRRVPGSVIYDADAVVQRAVRMVTTRRVQTRDGGEIALDADTLCVHGDTPGAAELARRIRAALEDAGVQVAPVGASLGLRDGV
jgi:5-oxoprolinase (ATP-hydrolysing) subunit A